jgi:hypothetical protein
MANYGQGLSGAAGGAQAGAALGSLLPGPGTAIGAVAGGVLGGIGGLFGGQEDPNATEYSRLLEEAKRRGMNPDAARSNWEADQRQLGDRLTALSQGHGPSLARQNMLAANDRGVSSQMAMAQSGRGNAGAASQNAMNNAAMLQAQNAQTMAGASIQEQQMALQQLGQLSGQAREQDMNQAQFSSNNAYRSQGYNDQLRLNALAGRSGLQKTPGIGDQLLGIGSQALGFYASQKAQQDAAAKQQGSGYTGGPGRGSSIGEYTGY